MRTAEGHSQGLKWSNEKVVTKDSKGKTFTTGVYTEAAITQSGKDRAFIRKAPSAAATARVLKKVSAANKQNGQKQTEDQHDDEDEDAVDADNDADTQGRI
jgi:hypothetical protein